MKLLPKELKRRLIAQARWNAGKSRQIVRPLAKLYCPWSGAIWLLSELDPDDHDLAFGLCDLGLGLPELGKVRLSELEAVRGPNGQTIERDRYFRAHKTLQEYVDDARTHRGIVT